MVSALDLLIGISPQACADVFSDISMACNLGTRHDFLTPVFLRLLNDDSRWVCVCVCVWGYGGVCMRIVPVHDDTCFIYFVEIATPK